MMARGNFSLPAVLLALGFQPASGEEERQAGQPDTRGSFIDHIVVTGTRIARPDNESASPIVTVLPELFESGAPTVEAALNQLPQLGPHGASTANNPSVGGQALVNLRGLGPTSTLVLLDGRRWRSVGRADRVSA